MSDRFVVIAVSLLTLLVMCGLLLVAMVWTPARIQRLDKRLDKLEELSAAVSVMHGQLDDLGKLEKKLSETALASAPLARIDVSLDEANQKIGDLAKTVGSLKGKMAARSDIDRLAGQVNQINQKLSATTKAETELKKLGGTLDDLKRTVDAMRMAQDKTLRDLTKDVKQLHLELQKVQAFMKRGAGDGVTP